MGICVVLCCGVTPGVGVSSASSAASKAEEVLVDLAIPSTVSLRVFLCCSSISIMIHLEKGIGGTIAKSEPVPSAAKEGYNDCGGILGITC